MPCISEMKIARGVALQRGGSLQEAKFTFHRSLVLLWGMVLLMFSVLKLFHVSDSEYAPCRRVLTMLLSYQLVVSAHKNQHRRGKP